MAQFKGLFYIGKTSSGEPVLIELDEAAIRLTGLVSESPFERVWEIEKIGRNDFNNAELVELHYGVSPPQYLEVKDPEFPSALKTRYPKALFTRSRYQSFVSGSPLPFLGVLVVFVLLVIGAYFWLVPKSADVLAANLPVSAEKKLGDALITGMLEDEKKDSVKTLYAQRFFNLLHGKQKNGPVSVTVVEKDQANAFAVPGGHIVVYKPIIALTRNYEEFAGLMAYENAHLVHRHSLKALFRNLSGYFLVSLLFGDVNAVLVVVAENADNLKSLQYNRELEKEADLTGLNVFQQNDIDPKGMLGLFSILKKENGKSSMPEFLSTHPVFDSRIAYLKEEIAKRKFHIQKNDSLHYYWQKLKE